MTSLKPLQSSPPLRPTGADPVAVPQAQGQTVMREQDTFGRVAERATVPGFGRPVEARELPDPGAGTAVMTLNLANGAGEGYRTPENRAKQAALIADARASVVGFQEVDAGVDRTRDVNTALDVVRRLNPAFDPFFSGPPVPVVDLHAPVVGTALRQGADGTRLYQTPNATLILGESFSGDDRPVAGDGGADATYGNALYVAAPNRVAEAYTVVLPHSVSSDSPPTADRQQLTALAHGGVTAEERAALGARNEGIRDAAASEPRTALVARLVGPDGKERTIINVHLAAGKENESLRQKQLAYLADLVRAEAGGSPAREVLVMGDFNDSTTDVGRGLEPAGLRRVVGGKKESFGNIDQVWVTGGMTTDTSAQVKTRGVTDHPHAGYTVLR